MKNRKIVIRGSVLRRLSTQEAVTRVELEAKHREVLQYWSRGFSQRALSLLLALDGANEPKRTSTSQATLAKAVEICCPGEHRFDSWLVSLPCESAHRDTEV